MSRVKLAFECCRNNSFGEKSAHHLELADRAKFIACSVKGFAHRGSCFRSKRALFCEGINWHGPLPLTPLSRIGPEEREPVKCNSSNPSRPGARRRLAAAVPCHK